MPNTKVLQYIHNILSYNVIGESQYQHRFDGFNGELHFSQWFRQNKKAEIFPGGIFVPLKRSSNKSSFENAVYILTVPLGLDAFITQQFMAVSQLATRGQYLVQYDPSEHPDSWTRLNIPSNNADVIELPYPSSLTICQFDPDTQTFKQVSIEMFWQKTGLRSAYPKKATISETQKNSYIDKLCHYDYGDILDLYINRFVLDGLCAVYGTNGRIQRGVPLDIDCFVRGNDDQWSIIEVKEKDLSKNGCFGMDVRRINSLLKLSQQFAARAFYIVCHVKDQSEREFINWKVIDMNKFNKQASSHKIEGGHGMRRKDTRNPTRLCKVGHFQELMPDFTSQNSVEGE